MSQRNVLRHLSANTFPKLTKFNSSRNFTAEQVNGYLQIGSRGCTLMYNLLYVNTSIKLLPPKKKTAL